MTIDQKALEAAAHAITWIDFGHVSHLDRARAAIEAYLGALPEQLSEEWRPIEEAPADALLLLGYWRLWPTLEWEVELGFARSTRGGWLHGRATHYRSLPPPPSQDDHRPDNTGLDDGPLLPGTRRRAPPMAPNDAAAVRKKAWATRREKYGQRGHK